MAIKKSKPAAPGRRKAAPVLPRRKRAGGPTEKDIAGRAYQLFIQRGGVHGHDREDWLLAERELGAHSPAASASP